MCRNCNKIFNKKSSYNSHINKKNPCKNIPLEITHDDINMYICGTSCIICNKTFVSKQNAFRHIKNSCNNVTIKVVADNVVKDIVTDGSNNNDICDLFQKLVTHPNYDKLAEMISSHGTIGGRSKGKNTTNIHNTTINNNNNINIQIKNTIVYPFGKEINNGFCLSEVEWLKIINKGFVSPIELIMIMHFNENLPQYQNIYLPNLKEKFIKCFDGNKWIADNKKKILLQLLNDKVEIISDKYEELKVNENCNKRIQPRMHNILPNLVKAVQDEKDSRIIELVDDIELSLYNNKHLPINTLKQCKE